MTPRGSVALLSDARATVLREWSRGRCQQCGSPTPEPVDADGQRGTEIECPRCHVRILCYTSID